MRCFDMLYNFCGIAVAAYLFWECLGSNEVRRKTLSRIDRARDFFKSQIGRKIGGELSLHYQSCAAAPVRFF